MTPWERFLELSTSRRWFVALALAVSDLGRVGRRHLALKLDAARLVLPKLEAAGELMKASEREISEAIEQAQRVALVGGVAKGLLLTPLIVLALAGALEDCRLALSDDKALFAETFTVAALTMLPLACVSQPWPRSPCNRSRCISR